MNHFVFLSFYFGATNGSPAFGMANSFVVRRVSPGRIIVVLFWTKYAVPRQIKPGIHKLTTSRGQRNLCTVFIFVSRERLLSYRFVGTPKFLTADRTAGSVAVCKVSNNPSYSRILIGSCLWSIRGQTHDWRHHYRVFASAVLKWRKVLRIQPRPQGLLLDDFQNGGSSGEDPGQCWTNTFVDWPIHTNTLIGLNAS